MSLPILLRDAHDGVDLLGRAVPGETLHDTLRALDPPACVALYGAWGSGKTQLLRAAHDHWELRPGEDKKDRCKRGVSVWFDPWEHERRGDVITPLLNALVERARAIGRVDVAALKKLAGKIAKTLLSFAAKIGATYLGLGAVSLGAAEKVGDAVAELDFGKLFDGQSKLHDEIQETKKSFAALVKLVLGDDPNAKLVLFLDDLDRCLPDSVIGLLEAVKLLLCGDTEARALFVFALDRQVVGDAIAHRYPSSSFYTGESYLEKIFDVSLEVPPVAQAFVEGFVGKQWPRMAEAKTQWFEPLGGDRNVADVLSDPAFANPRVIKRVLNRMALLLHSAERRKAVHEVLYSTDEVVHAENQQRFVAWVAGAERFRSFRYAFMDASADEVYALHAWCTRDADAILRGLGGLPAFAKIAPLPGFLRFYERVGLKKLSTKEAETQRIAFAVRQRPANLSPSLREFDDLLRGFGL